MPTGLSRSLALVWMGTSSCTSAAERPWNIGNFQGQGLAASFLFWLRLWYADLARWMNWRRSSPSLDRLRSGVQPRTWLLGSAASKLVWLPWGLVSLRHLGQVRPPAWLTAALRPELLTWEAVPGVLQSKAVLSDPSPPIRLTLQVILAAWPRQSFALVHEWQVGWMLVSSRSFVALQSAAPGWLRKLRSRPGRPWWSFLLEPSSEPWVSLFLVLALLELNKNSCEQVHRLSPTRLECSELRSGHLQLLAVDPERRRRYPC